MATLLVGWLSDPIPPSPPLEDSPGSAFNDADDGRTRDRKDGSRKPRLEGEHVGLPVHEHGERPAFRQMLGHEAEHRLVGVEVCPFPKHEDGGPQNRQEEHRP